jgi:hypothetical protein
MYEYFCCTITSNVLSESVVYLEGKQVFSLSDKECDIPYRSTKEYGIRGISIVCPTKNRNLNL